MFDEAESGENSIPFCIRIFIYIYMYRTAIKNLQGVTNWCLCGPITVKHLLVRIKEHLVLGGYLNGEVHIRPL